MAQAPTSDRYGEVLDVEVKGEKVTVIVVNPVEWEAHVKRVETLAMVLRDVLTAMADVPPFSMMVSAEQKAMLKAL